MGGMLTSIRDLSRYVSAFLEAWPPRDGTETAPISRASLREMQQVWRPRPAVAGRDGSGVMRLSAGGYGYGLGITQTCDYGISVAHSGGLPGFGSLMRWLPEYGVGIIAFGNRTYTGWGGVAEQALDLLGKTGGLQPRAVQPSPALSGAKANVSSLLERWDDRLADRIAAVNLFLDRSRDRRKAEFERFRSELGACRAAADFSYVENPLRGEWLFDCARGQLRAELTLAPTMPPLVQHLELRRVTGEEPPRQTCR
jgi:CubicO group peptidase (beta-lactamase class C family)